MGIAGRGGRPGPLGPLSQPRRHRRDDGARRPAGDGCRRRRRSVPPARWSARSRRLDWRKGTGPHGPGSPCRPAPRRRLDDRRQRADRTVRHRRLERPRDSPPARRHHRLGREAEARPPARPDPRFDRRREGHRLRGVGRHGRLGGLGRGRFGGGEPARPGCGAQPRRAGRFEPGAGLIGRRGRRVEPRGGRLPGTARVVREDRTPVGRDESRRVAHQFGPPRVPAGGRVRLRRGSESRREARPGPDPVRAAGVRERHVRGLVELRDGTAVETDGRPCPVGEFTAG